MEWTLGAPFLRKYQFVYDYGNKQIGYCHDRFRKEKEDDEYDGENGGKGGNIGGTETTEFWSYFFMVLVIIVLAGLLVGLGFLLGKTIYQIRKKRANELTDDDYEYNQKKISLSLNE